MAELPLHPRLARMVVDGRAQGDGWTACALAALLEDRDVLRGRPDDVPVDLAERLRLLADRDARHPLADRVTLASARRRAGELSRRAGAGSRSDPSGDRCGPVLALAYPDRIAKARGGSRFRLRSGGGAWLPATDALAGEPFLVVADLDADRRDSRIRTAAALDAAEVARVAGDDVVTHTTVSWDTRRGDLRATVIRRLDDLDLDVADGPAPPGPATTEALLDRVRATRLAALPWTEAARLLQARVTFLRSVTEAESSGEGPPWPDLTDSALLATIDDWLAPHLAGATGRADLDRLRPVDLLRRQLDWRQQRALEDLAPQRLTLGNGRTLNVGYDDGRPTAAARVQDLFGVDTHPAVNAGRTPVLMSLLSPAGRPVQVTADLPGFWTGSYAEVRKEMAGRYPKHRWPTDPASTKPGR
jgi:ATP-dependent helicase HrpB